MTVGPNFGRSSRKESLSASVRDECAHVVGAQPVLGDGLAQQALVGALPVRGESLEIGQRLLGEACGIGLVFGHQVHHAIGHLLV